MSPRLSLALVGIGGYGNSYVNMMLDRWEQRAYDLIGAIDPNPSACRRLDELIAHGVALYPSLESFYESVSAELVVLSTPIALHAPQTVLACAHGSDVLCEKPLCATLEDAAAMRDARDRFNRHVAIGYQWSFSRAVQALKADILADVFGRAKRLRTIVLWPRDEAYYRRNRWAGAQRDRHGNIVSDSPVMNACAHYLHNMLYVTGSRVDRSAEPRSVTAELYRAHPIENYDTGALRITTTGGAELVFIVSHATAGRVDPTFSYEFERGTVEFQGTPDAQIIARMVDGTTRRYGSPNGQTDAKLLLSIEAIRRGQSSVCGIEAAAAHTRCAVAAQASMPEIAEFPRAIVHVTGEPGRRATVVDGLDDVLRRCYAEWRLPSELGEAWARPGHPVSPAPLPDPDRFGGMGPQAG
ncbi:MAG TPA: Gfo/Idh/MocA family oxidoreductase [Tepidisphaeraceae bacterium]|nr:Gfo/Idh/MocA family oxidoreductase [Tepidisphaeraceae bacterium]